ncbi:hypothetical protein BD310DRAFT_936490 [Dichomitus squalens]|uniref:Uncharacterized protein n=1 Tax=Dichomitus squalens TaxID=114155 RepID=A0A4Q9PJB6_9APHY|nr:hypothetical protein BD310DRAFT_936490 [Dichomitus squalens]
MVFLRHKEVGSRASPTAFPPPDARRALQTQDVRRCGEAYNISGCVGPTSMTSARLSGPTLSHPLPGAYSVLIGDRCQDNIPHDASKNKCSFKRAVFSGVECSAFCLCDRLGTWRGSASMRDLSTKSVVKFLPTFEARMSRRLKYCQSHPLPVTTVDHNAERELDYVAQGERRPCGLRC